MDGERVLVTGAAGFNGKHAVRFLAEKGYLVRATDIKGDAREFKSMGVEFVKADLTRRKGLDKLVRDVDVVFHIAALFDYLAPFEKLRLVNVEGTKNLLDAILDSGGRPRVILWSSVAVYGVVNEKNYKLPVTEDQPLAEECPGAYDRSKREQEALALRYCEEYGLPVTVIRPAPIYGSGNMYGVYNIIWFVARGVLPFIPENASKLSLPMVHVADVTGAAHFLAGKREAVGEVYNVVDDNTLNAKETLELIAALTGAHPMEVPVIPVKLFGKVLVQASKLSAFMAKRRGERQKLEPDMLNYLFGNYYFSNEKLKRAGYKFIYPDRRVGLAETISWYISNGVL
ncbi:MAG: NAD-dependent epimerase/dehydratase family protein [Candidatus Freyarchaeota archaeon]